MPAISEAPLAKKLLIKPGYRVVLIDAPKDHARTLEPLPDGASIGSAPAGGADFVQFWAQDTQQLAANTPKALKALKPGGVLWVTFPRGSSKIQTDLSRDKGWDVLHKAGWQLVGLVSVDDTWSAGRVRPIK